MIDWKPYLQAVCQTCDRWWDNYTITDVVGKNHDKKMAKSLLFDLQAFTIKPETTKPDRELSPEAREEKEILNVLEGLRKYAAEHVLLIGRPGSGKSTALKRLLLEESKSYLNSCSLALPGNSDSEAPPPDYHEAEPRSVGSQPETRKQLETAQKTRIPVLVELRYYETSTIDLITAFLYRHDPTLPIDSETVKQLLRQGNFFLLIDGVNELPSQEARSHLQKFRHDYQQTTPMIFTTRDLGVGGDLGIAKKLEMQPLTETQMGEFVRGYLGETGEAMLQQLGGRLREFGKTPLLLWMLCSVFDSNGNQIPPNLGSVFRRFTEIYDRQIKQDIPVTDESRRWWKRLLQHLAWVMMGGNTTNPQCRDAIHRVSLPSTPPTEFLIAIPRQQAEEIFTKYLEGKVNCAADCAIKWLDDLLKHHLIQIGAENKIEFRHQLIQEYYAAERFLQEVGKLSDDELQWDYLNYLKWTEPTALMLGLVDDEGLALRVVRLALQVDWQLGARLAGEVRFEWQEKTLGLVEGLNFPVFLRIRFLERTKSNIVTPELIKLLEDEDSSVRRSAASALGEIKFKVAIPGLIKLLENEDSSVRNSAVYALREIKSESAIYGLIKLLEDENSDVRSNAVSALAEIKSEAAIPGLIKLLEDENSSVRRSAASALGEIKSKVAIPGLIKLLENEDSSVRNSAVYALREIKSESAIYGLIKLLEDEDSSVRRSAAFALAEIKSETAIPGFIQKILEDEESSVRRSTALALEIRSEAAILGFIQVLENEDSSIRRIAALALSEIKSKVAIPGLIQVLKDEDSFVRRIAAFTLGEIKSEAAIPGLIQLLEDENSDVRKSAADALGEIKSELAIPQLIKLIEDENSDIRMSAANVLAKIKPDAAIPGLIQLLEDICTNVRYRAANALGKTKSEVTMINLVKVLNNSKFIQQNNGENALNALNALEQIQQHLKYYKPKPDRTMSNILSHNYALLIGVGECEEPKLSLPTTVKDIEAVKTLLTDEKLCGYIDNNQHLRLLSNNTATSANILDGLNWLKQQAENDPEATIFIYYSGHGCLDASGDYYLIPHETDRTDIPDTALPATTFNTALQQIPAKQLLVIIDSCHAQGMASSKEGGNNRSPLPKGFTQTALPKNIIQQGKGKVVFTSSTGNQVSWIRPDGKMSVYTYHLLEALQGAANQPGDKVVKVSHLMNHLSKTVPATARDLCKAEQTPFFSFETEDFPVALLCGGKGLAIAGYDKQQTEETIRGISINQSVTNSNVGNIVNINAEKVSLRDISSGS